MHPPDVTAAADAADPPHRTMPSVPRHALPPFWMGEPIRLAALAGAPIERSDATLRSWPEFGPAAGTNRDAAWTAFTPRSGRRHPPVTVAGQTSSERQTAGPPAGAAGL